MSRRVDFETILKDKFFYFKSEEGDVAVATATEFGQNKPQNGACILWQLFYKHALIQQKVKQAYGRNSICLPHFFIDSFILLLFCTVRFLRICILLFGCIRIVCCAGCFRCAVIGLFYALTWHIC